MALGVFVVATALLALAPLEQSQAQLYIDVYQSRDNTNQTLWIFSGSGTTRQLWSVRNNAAGNANYHRRDSWEVWGVDGGSNGDLYAGTEPTGQLVALSSITNQNAVTSRERWYVANILTNITTATTPTISFTTNSVTRSESIASLYMNGGDSGVGRTLQDDIGIRVSGGSFRYDAGATSAWSGAGILAKPISDFEIVSGAFPNRAGAIGVEGPLFAANNSGSVRIRLHHGTIIPEPEEYALLFGLFALGFVFFHRRMMQKKRPASG